MSPRPAIEGIQDPERPRGDPNVLARWVPSSKHRRQPNGWPDQPERPVRAALASATFSCVSSPQSFPQGTAERRLRLAGSQTVDVLALLIKLGQLRRTSALTVEEYELQRIKLARSLATG
jgi:hypothetical protein